jgi:ribonuclease P protein component
MLPKQERLGRKDIKILFGERTSFYKGKILSLKIKKRRDKNIRWAFSVSSTIKKNAPARNKTRRRLSESACVLGSLITQGADMFFMTKLTTKHPPSYKALKDDMIYILKSCGVLL